MGYDAAREKMSSYRAEQVSALLGRSPRTWFAELWGGIAEMLKTFDSSQENRSIVSGYAKGHYSAKAGSNLRLDYVCGLRREVRKQFVSEDDDIYTDVTPFRHGVISAHGASVFDNTMDTVIGYSEKSGGALA